MVLYDTATTHPLSSSKHYDFLTVFMSTMGYNRNLTAP
jgi:hypothetical protein